jgi:hypothetical protein
MNDLENYTPQNLIAAPGRSGRGGRGRGGRGGGRGGRGGRGRGRGGRGRVGGDGEVRVRGSNFNFPGSEDEWFDPGPSSDEATSIERDAHRKRKFPNQGENVKSAPYFKSSSDGADEPWDITVAAYHILLSRFRAVYDEFDDYDMVEEIIELYGITPRGNFDRTYLVTELAKIITILSLVNMAGFDTLKYAIRTDQLTTLMLRQSVIDNFPNIPENLYTYTVTRLDESIMAMLNPSTRKRTSPPPRFLGNIEEIVNYDVDFEIEEEEDVMPEITTPLEPSRPPQSPKPMSASYMNIMDHIHLLVTKKGFSPESVTCLSCGSVIEGKPFTSIKRSKNSKLTKESYCNTNCMSKNFK